MLISPYKKQRKESARLPLLQQGFTLLEILIALFIMAILMSMTVTIIFNVLHTRKRVQTHLDELAQLQTAMLIMQSDIAQMVNRPLRPKNAPLVPAIIGNANSVSFTRTGATNPFNAEKRSNLLRITYSFTNHQLIREAYTPIDETHDTKTTQRVILKNIQALTFHFRIMGQMRPFWQSDSKMQNVLPSAIQLEMTLDEWGEMNRLFPVANGQVPRWGTYARNN